jgi:hypothetical protein
MYTSMDNADYLAGACEPLTLRPLFTDARQLSAQEQASWRIAKRASSAAVRTPCCYPAGRPVASLIAISAPLAPPLPGVLVSLQYNGFEVSTVACTDITGQPAAGGHALAFFLTFQPKQIPNGAMSDAEATEVRDLRLRVTVTSGRKTLLLGFAGCLEQAFVRVDKYGHVDTKRFEFVLGEGQLAAIEEARGIGGVSFSLELFATSVGNKGPWYAKAELKVGRSVADWVKLLSDMGSAEYLCVPVALPKVGVDDVHAPAIKWLQSAQKFMLQGEYATAIGECRHALDSLTSLTEDVAEAGGFAARVKESRVLEAYNSPRRQERKRMTRGQRLVLVRLAVYHLTNISHHQAEHPEQTLSRQDASLVLASTAALLSASIAQRFDSGEEEEQTD